MYLKKPAADKNFKESRSKAKEKNSKNKEHNGKRQKMIDPGIEPGTCCDRKGSGVKLLPLCKADVITATPIDQPINN